MVGFYFHFNRCNGVEKIVDAKNDNIHPSIHPHTLNEKIALFGLWTRPHVILAKPSPAKIQPNWIPQLVTLIETMGSVVFTWGPFEVALASRPITILFPCFELDWVKKNMKFFEQNVLFPYKKFTLLLFLQLIEQQAINASIPCPYLQQSF